MFAGCGAGDIGVIHLLADRAVVQVGHQRRVTGRLQGEPPAFKIFRFRTFAGRVDSCGGQACQFRFIGDEQLKCVCGVQNIFTELCGEHGKLYIDFGKEPLARRIEFRTLAAKGVQRLGQQPLFSPGKLGRFGCSRKFLDHAPESGVEHDAGVVFADFRLHGIVGGAQFGISCHRLQMPGHLHCVVQLLGHVLQRHQGVRECARPGAFGQGFLTLPRLP